LGEIAVALPVFIQGKGKALLVFNSGVTKYIKTQLMNYNPISSGPKEINYPPTPTGSTKFWRKFFPWQVVRFFVLNIKIMRIIIGGHS
jgi:hypothetical protein